MRYPGEPGNPPRDDIEECGEVQLKMMTRIVPSTEALEITVDHREEGSIVRLRGRLNIDSSPVLRDQLLAMLETQPPQVVIVNFNDVSYVDSSGIATVIEGLGIARMRQATLCLQGSQGPVLRLFHIIGISSLFENNGCGSASSVSQRS